MFNYVHIISRDLNIQMFRRKLNIYIPEWVSNYFLHLISVELSSVQSHSGVRFFATS